MDKENTTSTSTFEQLGKAAGRARNNFNLLSKIAILGGVLPLLTIFVMVSSHVHSMVEVIESRVSKFKAVGGDFYAVTKFIFESISSPKTK